MNILVVDNGLEGKELLESLEGMNEREVYHFTEKSSLYDLDQACSFADVVFCFDDAEDVLETLMRHKNICSVVSCNSNNASWNERVAEYGELTGAKVSFCSNSEVFSDKERLFDLISA